MARPKEFDRGQVLDRAMDVFWHKGYESSSLQDLVERMGCFPKKRVAWSG